MCNQVDFLELWHCPRYYAKGTAKVVDCQKVARSSLSGRSLPLELSQVLPISPLLSFFVFF